MARHLKPFGREYVAMNILWYEPAVDDSRYHAFANLDMDEYGRLIPPVGRSPSSATEIGFKALSDLIHDLDLRFGIHILRGIPGQAVHPNPLVVRTSARARDIAHPISICPWNTDLYGVDASPYGAQEY